MSRTLLRAAVAGALVAAVPFVAACAAGPDAQTTMQFNHVDGTNRNLGNLQLRSVYAEAGASGRADKGGSVELVAYIYNRSHDDDALLSVTSPQATGATFTVDGKPANEIPVPALVGAEITERGGSSKIELTGLTKSLLVGQIVDVTMQFRNAGQISFGVPVEALHEEFGPQPTRPATIAPQPPGPDVTSVPLYRETKPPGR